MSMKRFRRVSPVLLGSLLLAPVALPAQTLPATKDAKPAPQISKEDAAAERYAIAVALLKQGRNFEKAIALLQTALQSEPNNGLDHLALGCAYACRAAAIGDAFVRLPRFEQDKEKYKQWQAAWEVAQKDPNNPAYKQPTPKPPVLKTKDDDRPFTLTPEATTKTYLELAVKAQAEWDKTLALSTTPMQHGEALYTQGWGKSLLRKFNYGIVKEEKPPKEKGGPLPTEKQIVEDFDAATKINPKDARFWQSLGDALRGKNWYRKTAAELALSTTAYQKSLAIDDRNSILWYRLYQLNRKEKPELAEDAIRHAAQASGDNAYFTYQFAGTLLAQTRYSSFPGPYQIIEYKPENEVALKKFQSIPETNEGKQREANALAAMEQGNKMLRCKSAHYVPCLPPLLISAWNFQEDASFSEEVGETYDLDLLLTGYGRVMLRESKFEEALRAANAIIGFGSRQVKEEMSNPSSNIADVSHGRLSMQSVIWGYGLLQEIYGAMGNTISATQARNEYKKFEAQYFAFYEAQNVARSNRYMTSDAN